MRQIAATRKARQKRAFLTVLGAASMVTLLLASSGWVLTSYVSHRLGRVNAGTSGTPSSGPVNILVAGVDTRSGLTLQEEKQLHVGDAISTNSDTLMLVHIPANHASVQEVSLPRDSWVNIPGHGMNKINAAFGIGGAQLMVKTVEQATGLTINDYAEVNFLGFVKVINAVGGVNVCVPFAVNDPDSGLRLSAGEHHVNGVTALKFARDRHSFAQSDLARIDDQQQLISSMFTEATQSGLLTDPIRLQAFLSSVTAAVKVDKGFNVVRLAGELRGLRPSDVTFTTVPLATVNYTTPTGESAVLWNKAAASTLFTRLKNDTGLPAKGTRDARHSGTKHSGTKHSATKASGPTRAQVSLDVYNGTKVKGLSAATGKRLTGLGFGVHQAGLDWPAHNVRRTQIQYPAGQAATARLLRTVLPGAQLKQVSGLSRIRLILGKTGHAISATAGPASAQPSPSPSAGQATVPGQQRTAAQDACH